MSSSRKARAMPRFSQQSFCQGCLSKDRRLANVHTSILRMVVNIDHLSSHIPLCWECRAELKRIFKFKNRITRVHKYLETKTLDEVRRHASLSSLGIMKNEPIDIANLDVPIENSETYKVKQEVDDFQNDENDALNNDGNEMGNNDGNEMIGNEYYEDYDYLDNDTDPIDTNHSDNDEKESKLSIIKVENEDEGTKDVNQPLINVEPLSIERTSVDNNETNIDTELKEINEVKEEDYTVKEEFVSKLSISDKFLFTRGNKYKIFHDSKEFVGKLKNKVRFKSVQEHMCCMEKDRKTEMYERRKNKCLDCVAYFSTKQYLDVHRNKVHNKQNPYICDVCKKRFKRKIILMHHIKVHNVLYECKMCLSRFSSRKLFVLHVTLKHKERVKCNNCELSFGTLTLFYDHYKEYHKVFICECCSRKFKTRKAITNHFISRMPTKCEECDSVYPTRAHYLKHRYVRHSQKPISKESCFCVECNKQFKDLVSFKTHLLYTNVHNGGRTKKTFKCTECDNVYTRKKYMVNHYNYVHLKETKHYCKICNQYFVNSTGLCKHNTSKHGGPKAPKNKICTYCSKGFAVKASLENHIRTHTGERPFICEYCSHGFAQKYALKTHIRHVHEKVKRKYTAKA